MRRTDWWTVSQDTQTAADVRRAEIVAHAARLFDEKGYHRTSLGEIAAAVGVQKPTLYHYFHRKDEILFWIHEAVIDVVLERHLARQGTAMSASQQLLEVIADVLELNETRPGYGRVFFEHVRELSADDRTVVREKRDRYLKLVEGLLEEGVQSGEFRELNIGLTALSILGSCNWSYQWFRPQPGSSSRQVAYVFWDIAMRGVSAQPTDGR